MENTIKLTRGTMEKFKDYLSHSGLTTEQYVNYLLNLDSQFAVVNQWKEYNQQINSFLFENRHLESTVRHLIESGKIRSLYLLGRSMEKSFLSEKTKEEIEYSEIYDEYNHLLEGNYVILNTLLILEEYK